MKTVPVKLGEGGPVIGTCTIDEKNKTMHTEYDDKWLAYFKNKQQEQKLVGVGVTFDATPILDKTKGMRIIDMVVSPECGTCEMKALKEKEVESIEIKSLGGE